ncbi:MAG: helix-turn-helix transcriptional regulator [Chitinophagales bacterium]|nr:helix-turn-helix transcriptional regulator [Hyphomicrobiales bacterium]
MDTAIPLNKKLNRRYDTAPGCPMEATLDMIGGKWKAVILYHLLDGTLRFSELRRRLNKITQRMLTKQLRELEDAGLVARKVYAEVPPRVEYSLTPLGASMEPVIEVLFSWGQSWLQKRMRVPLSAHNPSASSEHALD